MKGNIHPHVRLGAVHLVVSNIQHSLAFYEGALGLDVRRLGVSAVALGVQGAETLVHLTELPNAQMTPNNSTGLYHFALLVPQRKDLAWALTRLLAHGTEITGLSDHVVSEAIYVSDPDGNGIEICCDRPREQWCHENGQIHMATHPLVVDGLLSELDREDAKETKWPLDTSLGHVHLCVPDLYAAEEFYCNVLGFDLVLRHDAGAAFVSAGGYHHHIGLNTWRGTGAQPPPIGSVGLRWYTVCFPSFRALSGTVDRIRASGKHIEERKEGLLVLDPAHNSLMLAISTT